MDDLPETLVLPAMVGQDSYLDFTDKMESEIVKNLRCSIKFFNACGDGCCVGVRYEFSRDESFTMEGAFDSLENGVYLTMCAHMSDVNMPRYVQMVGKNRSMDIRELGKNEFVEFQIKPQLIIH